jgi:hypothetical protein
MFRKAPGFDGNPFYAEKNWVGIIIRGGFGHEMRWLTNILRNVNPAHPGFVCKRVELPNDAQNEWRDRDNPLDKIVFDLESCLDHEDEQAVIFGALKPYIHNFDNASHYFEALDGTWRMHLPCDEQADRWEYKIWAGTPEVWLKLRPHFEPLPRYEPAQSGPLIQAYARDFVYLTDDPEIPRNVVAGLGPVRFAADAGYGWSID